MKMLMSFLAGMGMAPSPKMSQAQEATIREAQRSATDSASQLAGALERLERQSRDPFGTFAARARASQFHRSAVGKGG